MGWGRNLPSSGRTQKKSAVTLEQQFSTGVLEQLLKHAIADYVVRGTDLFSLRLSNKKMITANITIAIWCE